MDVRRIRETGSRSAWCNGLELAGASSRITGSSIGPPHIFMHDGIGVSRGGT